MAGVILMLIPAGSDRFIYPIGMLFLGTLLNAYGQFSHHLIRWLGWSYIVLAAVTGQYSWKSIEYPPDANFPRVLSRRIRT